MNSPQAAAPEVFLRRIMGVETEYGILSTGGTGALFPEEAARLLFRPVMERYLASNVFIPNGARLYLDVGTHPEVATAECDDILQLIAYEKAGDAIVADLARRAEQEYSQESESAPEIHVLKNNVDSRGNSFGCHENYLVSRHMVLKKLGLSMLPFIITRQLICGAGALPPAFPLPGLPDPATGFQFSQRADHMWDGVSSATTRSRPMINTRDEPHADSARFRRLHVIVGDSNMSETSMLMKVASTTLVLEMIESGFPMPSFDIALPTHAIQLTSRDLSGRAAIPLSDGSTITPLEISWAYQQAAEKYLDTRTPDPSLSACVAQWAEILQAIEQGNFAAIADRVDWAIKYQLLATARERHNLEWNDPRLARIDIAYHDLRAGSGLYSSLVNAGRIRREVTDAAIDQAMVTAPQTTRAKLRGEVFQANGVDEQIPYLAAAQPPVPLSVDWSRIKAHTQPDATVVDLLDPFATQSAEVTDLVARLVSH